MSEREQPDPKALVEEGQTVDKSEESLAEKVNTATSLNKTAEQATSDNDNTTVVPTGDEIDADGDSEAETLIQSPEKKRGSLVDGPTVVHPLKVAGSDAGSIVLINTSDKENATRKRKRSHDGRRRSTSNPSSRRSSPLSSPVAQMHSESDSNDERASAKKVATKQRGSPDIDDKTHSPARRRRRPSELVPPSSVHKRSKRNSVDNIERRETRSATYPRPSDEEKSPSPEPVGRREHRRGASTQLTMGEMGEKRKRGRPPLLNTKRNRSVDRASEDSDASEPRTSRARPPLAKLSSLDQDIMSPARPGPRKWKDKVGRTPLARACNDGDLEVVQARFLERAEDLHEQDNAKNTPLQIASIEGWDEVVKFLLSKGADVNVRNIDGDTPLIDAVENGHIPVIKLLLKSGANPRMANMKGYEPAELAKPDDDNYDEIKALLEDAKDKQAKKTPLVDTYDYHNRDGATSRAASAASPRDSPPAGTRSPPAFSSRRRTGRSESTRNDLLYQANTQENLVKLAGKGDVQGVANILSILEKAETESLIAAAKAGHEEVLQLLIAMGKPNPDPDPVRGPKLPSGFNTPMLAAIGRGHPDVVKLLANQSGFNPTRKLRDRTYFELAEERKGDRWEEEVTILKQAYDRFKGKKTNSPRKTRDGDKRPRSSRRSSSANSASRRMPSPIALHKSQAAKNKDIPGNEKRKVSDPLSERRKQAASEDLTESSTAIASDLEVTTHQSMKTHRTRRSHSDLPEMSGQETGQKRRRLVTGKEHRSRHTASNSSDDEGRDRVKHEDRPQSALKRSRANSTPEPSDDKSDRSALKKRRTVLESSPDEARSRPMASTRTAASVLDGENDGNEDRAMGDVDELDEKDEIKQTSMEGVAVKRESPTPAPEIIPAEELTAILAKEPSETDVSKSATSSTEPEPVTNPVEPSSNMESSDAGVVAMEVDDTAAREARQREEDETRKQEEEQQRIAEAEAKARAEAAAQEAREAQEAEERRKQEEARLQEQREAEERERERVRREIEARELQERLEREKEQERIRNLPMLLARTAEMIDASDVFVKQPKFLKSKYLPLYAVTANKLDHLEASATSEERWVPSFQVAGLLSTKDLSLSTFPTLSKKPTTEWHRHCMWRCARLKLSYDLDRDSWATPVTNDIEAERIAERRFMALAESVLWIKQSDFLHEAANSPHLRDIKLSIQDISLRSYSDILGATLPPRLAQSPAWKHGGLPNGISTAAHTNGIS